MLAITSRRCRAALTLLVLLYIFYTVGTSKRNYSVSSTPSGTSGWGASPKVAAVPVNGEAVLSAGEGDDEGDETKAMIIASMKKDDTSWYERFPDWEKRVYVVDDPEANLTVERNKGREGNVYLTYIIDNYDHLPHYMLFLHAERYQWHNDDPNYDGLPPLSNLQLPYLRSQGYINLRCVHTLGCPAEIRPYLDIPHEDVHAGPYFKSGFESLFPGVPVPDAIGVPCCAQFGVTREQVRTRSREEYVHYREWLLNSSLPDALSGRIMEYSWHMIFGKEAVHCPPAGECYCKQFGLCDLVCDDPWNMTCAGRYILPPYSTLPEGWPVIGWEGEVRAGFEEEAGLMKLQQEKEREEKEREKKEKQREEVEEKVKEASESREI